jgi:hypothetical protein
MFESRIRPLNIPQMEHSRLAGRLAAHWGNADFARPPIPFEGFVRGVTLHDWAYGPLDDAPLLRMDDERWLTVQQRGLAHTFGDTTTDLIVKLHYQRLLGWNGSHEARGLAARYDLAIEALAAEHPTPLPIFQQIDTLTQLCDMVAFDFSFEEPTERTLRVHAAFGEGADPIEVRYRLAEGGRVTVEPWPFDAPQLRGFILGYRRAGYPDDLDPVVVPYTISP